MNTPWRKPHNGPYGAPRGNAVMAAKRTTGPSAQEILRLRMLDEALLTRTKSDGSIERFRTIEAYGKAVHRHGKPW